MSDDVDLLEFAANKTEREFARAVRKKGGKCFRSGWPDFLIELQGKTLGVEVKSGEDVVRASQAAMFEVLERAGIRVYVWNPLRPKWLTPWRAYRPVAPRSRFRIREPEKRRRRRIPVTMR